MHNMAQNKKIRVGITHGDINGIGYEVIMKALEDPLMTDLCTPIVYGSSKALSYHRKALEMGNVNFTLVPRAEDAADGVNNLVEVVDGEVRIELGSPSEAAGKAALAALKRAADDLRNGIIDVMVTAPINKDSIQGDDFHFPGHTEFLESRIGEGNKALMILFDDHLRVAKIDKGEKKLLEFKWVTSDELRNIDLRPINIRDMLINEEYLKGLSHIVKRG